MDLAQCCLALGFLRLLSMVHACTVQLFLALSAQSYFKPRPLGADWSFLVRCCWWQEH